MLDCNYVTSFSTSIAGTEDRSEIKKILIDGRARRFSSEKGTYFWNFAQKAIHRSFDAEYAKGMKKLADSTEKISLHSSLSTVFVKEGVQGTKIGAGALASWFLAWVYGNSMSNLILHEEGHAWACKLIYNDVSPETHTNAWHWLKTHNWYNWFWGVREGGPGNYTTIPTGPLTEFGKFLSDDAKALLIDGGGIGAELALNLFIASMGLLAIRNKHRILGASLLMFALSAHSAAHSYIRRSSVAIAGGDPLEIGEDISRILNCDFSTAFQLLYWGYLLLPIALVGLMAAAFLKPTHAIPDEFVLMRLLAEKSGDLSMILTEVEIELDKEIQKLPKEQGICLITRALLQKIHANPQASSLFNETREILNKEYKGKFYRQFNWSDRLRIVAAITATLAYFVLGILKNSTVPILKEVFTAVTATFIVSQTISLIFDIMQSISDWHNQSLSHLAKGLSISRTTLSIASLAITIGFLLTPGLNATFLIVLTTLVALRVIIYIAHTWEIRRLVHSRLAETS